MCSEAVDLSRNTKSYGNQRSDQLLAMFGELVGGWEKSGGRTSFLERCVWKAAVFSLVESLMGAQGWLMSLGDCSLCREDGQARVKADWRSSVKQRQWCETVTVPAHTHQLLKNTDWKYISKKRFTLRHPKIVKYLECLSALECKSVNSVHAPYLFIYFYLMSLISVSLSSVNSNVSHIYF